MKPCPIEAFTVPRTLHYDRIQKLLFRAVVNRVLKYNLSRAERRSNRRTPAAFRHRSLYALPRRLVLCRRHKGRATIFQLRAGPLPCEVAFFGGLRGISTPWISFMR
jgi:hypothetical protein